MCCSMLMQIYAVYWLRLASSAFSLAKTCNWLAAIMVMRCLTMACVSVAKTVLFHLPLLILPLRSIRKKYYLYTSIYALNVQVLWLDKTPFVHAPMRSTMLVNINWKLQQDLNEFHTCTTLGSWSNKYRIFNSRYSGSIQRILLL